VDTTKGAPLSHLISAQKKRRLSLLGRTNFVKKRKIIGEQKGFLGWQFLKKIKNNMVEKYGIKKNIYIHIYNMYIVILVKTK